MNISINNSGNFSIRKKQIDKLFRLIGDEFEKLSSCEVSIAFVDNLAIKKINKLYRHINKPTDVLSFAEFGDIKKIKKKSFLGEIIISHPYIKKQAKINKKFIHQEIAYMLIHGFLHLVGYNHLNKKDEQIMRLKEKTIMLKYDKIK